MIIDELDQYVTAGSELVVVTEFGDTTFPEPKNMTAEVRRASATDRGTLESLGVAAFDQVIVLCYSDHLDSQRADARTLVTLLHLRDMLADVAPDARPAIVSEMLDDRNRELAQVTEVDDVIVSDKILSLVLAQISENAALEAVFADLLDADGSEIYLRPVDEYVQLGAETSFATLVEAARRRDESAIGYRTAAQSHDPAEAVRRERQPAQGAALRAGAGRPRRSCSPRTSDSGRAGPPGESAAGCGEPPRGGRAWPRRARRRRGGRARRCRRRRPGPTARPQETATRGREVRGDPADRRLGRGPVGAGQQHGELVAAHPGQRVGRAQRAADPLDGPAEQLVAGRVAVGVVVLLELVEVEQHEARQGARAG